uniref:uncharacterized protein LOC120332373 isoform X1 n=1 Tax=Styela clava TaxID=7725 RepID=UPI00193AC62E|nr:uncharacterized protein LOC120332373 isoform X1 [Styela clava]
MAATLSIQDYLQHFLLNRDLQLAKANRVRLPSHNDAKVKPSSPIGRNFSDGRQPSPDKTMTYFPQNHGIMLANVYQVTKDGTDNLLYSKKITGQKNKNIFGIFVQDMMGTKARKASNILDGRMSRGSSISDISSIMSNAENEEGVLQPNTTVSINLTSSRSPSNLGSAELIGLLDHCRQLSIRVTIHLRFAHSYTWDNKYNREGLETLHSRGVKLSPISFPQIIQNMIEDLQENIESFDEFQTCRGTIIVDRPYVNRAISELRQSLTIRSDFYQQDQQEQLAEILGKCIDIPQYKKFFTSDLPEVFSLETYREYILLQNADVEWIKIKVGTTKVKKGITKEESAYEKVVGSLEKLSLGNKGPKQPERPNKLDLESIWEKVGSKVSMGDLSECEQIVISVNVFLSEYTGRTGWVEEVTQLHNFLRDKTEDGELYKPTKPIPQVRVETRIRYAQCIEGPALPMQSKENTNDEYKIMNGYTNGYATTSFGFPKGMRIECLHVQDILFEMLEDLEDNIRYVSSLDYERGANLSIDREALTRAMGLLNKSIKIKTSNGEYSMNEDFVDDYADEMNEV